MSNDESYTRKISSEEAREGYIFILKNRLSLFPPIGKSFTIVDRGNTKRAVLESYHCTCRGPERAHDHYIIKWAGLRRGDKITIGRDKQNPGRYVCSTKP